MNPVALAVVAAYLAIPPRTVHLDDLRRFPPVAEVEATLVWMESHEEWLKRQIALDRWREHEYREWLWDVGRRKEAWDHLNWALTTDTKDSSRCNRLRALRRLIGPADYQRGVMPAPAPVWWFEEMP